MNLKNSKFFKRIQELRKISKEKARKEKERRARLDYELDNALNERNGFIQIPTSGINVQKENKLKAIDENQKEEISLSNNNNRNNNNNNGSISDDIGPDNSKTRGLIHLNNVCFRLKCTAPPPPQPGDNEPTIAATKGSICIANSRYTIIGKISKSLGYRVVKETRMWNVLWMDSLPGVETYKSMKRFQQINHFPGMFEICRKDLLSRNLNRMLKLFPQDYKIFPKTWVFPADYGEALNVSNNNYKTKPRTFIIKPDAGARGRGIWLTNDLRTVNPTERMICQTYIQKPLLIDGYKFDLRVYTLITSVDPLRIFVYNEGLARFATSKYTEPNTTNTTDLFMHLTNYSVNKRNSQYDLCDNDDCGSKRRLSAISNWMRRRNYNVDDFWAKIDDIIIKTVLSAWPMLKHNYHACFPAHDIIQACFEILGFDILVDSKMRPYILEVNHSPSFHMNEAVDRQVKPALIRDTLALVSTALADKRQILREDRKRVKQRLLNIKPGDIQRANTANITNTDINKKQSIQELSSFKQTPEDEPCLLSPLAQQIAWEESHLGDFRRIMPPTDHNKLNYYCQFYANQNQSSIYGETAASKKREEVAKKTRLQLEENRQKHELLMQNVGKLKLDQLRSRNRRANLTRAVLERKRILRFKAQAQWTPGFISEAEERLRKTWMQMRMDILNGNKIVQLVFHLLYNTRNLTNADILNYPELYSSLENGFDILEV